MRCALEAAAVRLAPSMNAQNASNSLWALATLGFGRVAVIMIGPVPLAVRVPPPTQVWLGVAPHDGCRPRARSSLGNYSAIAAPLPIRLGSDEPA
jgi:hypothetical protein